MKTFFRLSIFLIVAAALVTVAQHQHQQHSQSSNAAQQMNKIKTLTDVEVENYLNGRGMGLAKPAELNSYPGPMHVLQLAEPLGLSPQQKQATQQAFERMHAEAVRLGESIIAKESEIDRLFASGKVEAQGLAKLTHETAIMHGELRLTHLRAHLEMKRVLSPAQISKYDELRGYKTAQNVRHGNEN